jgi:hypothetical protein
MYGFITSLVTLLWLAAYTVLADSAPAQLPNPTPAPVGCTADNNCGGDASVVEPQPLDR